MTNIFQSEALALVAGVLYLASSLFVLVVAHKRSKFSFILLVHEYFYIFGFGIGLVILVFGYGANDDFFKQYLVSNGVISNLSFIHLIFYSCGMALGMAAYRSSRMVFKFSGFFNKALKYPDILNYRILLFLGFFCLLIYMFMVGPELAFISAASARAGSMDGLEGASSLLFLKNIAQVGTLAVIFLPLVFERRRVALDIGLFIIYGFLLYFLTGARAAITDTIFFAIMIYISRTNLNFIKKIMLLICCVLGFLFVMFGKGLGDEIFSYIFGHNESFNLREANFDILMGQFINLVFSMDAGVKNFFQEGPVLSKAIILAPLGVMPGWLFDQLGLSWLSWQRTGFEENIVCINTEAYPSAIPCTVPPYFIGFAAYIFPVAFGFVFGFVKFYAISMVSKLWQNYQSKPDLLWIPLIIFIFIERVSLFIPNVIGLLSFFSILIFFVFRVRGFFGRELIGK